jgi:hypothetical protein
MIDMEEPFGGISKDTRFVALFVFVAIFVDRPASFRMDGVENPNGYIWRSEPAFI